VFYVKEAVLSEIKEKIHDLKLGPGCRQPCKRTNDRTDAVSLRQTFQRFCSRGEKKNCGNKRMNMENATKKETATA
jgi:hypothetical protein